MHELSIDIFPEDGCLFIIDAAEETITAFTDYGVECLRQIIRDSSKTAIVRTSSRLDLIARPPVPFR